MTKLSPYRTMNHHQLTEYALNKPVTSLRYPFDPDLPVLFVHEKMFALLGHTNGIQSVNLKGDPEQNWLLREQYQGTVLPGYHMNKRHWNTIILDGTVPDSILLQLIDESYQLVWRSLPRSLRQLNQV